MCQNGQACLGEDIQHGRDAPTGRRGGRPGQTSVFRRGGGEDLREDYMYI